MLNNFRPETAQTSSGPEFYGRPALLDLVERNTEAALTQTNPDEVAEVNQELPELKDVA